jgi:hypothetical protein
MAGIYLVVDPTSTITVNGVPSNALEPKLGFLFSFVGALLIGIFLQYPHRGAKLPPQRQRTLEDIVGSVVPVVASDGFEALNPVQRQAFLIIELASACLDGKLRYFLETYRPFISDCAGTMRAAGETQVAEDLSAIADAYPSIDEAALTHVCSVISGYSKDRLAEICWPVEHDR